MGILEKKEEKNNVKILSYVSKINKSNKESRKLFQELMRNLKFEFVEKETCIKYTDYFFNGIPAPKNIEINNISMDSADITWKIDDLNILNLNNKEIKFLVEIRKGKEKFVKVYDGNNTNFKFRDLIRNTEYEFRICSYFNNIIGNWSEIKKFKTLESLIDSKILNESKREKEFLSKIYEWTNYKKLELIYRASRDGMNSNNFHNKCDNKNPTLILYKINKDSIFGGYTSLSWSNSGGYRPDPQAFIFTLKNIHNYEPNKFNTKDNSQGVYHDSNYGPTFGEGCDIYINQHFLKSDSSSDFHCRYVDTTGKGRSLFTGDFNNSNSSFRIKEIEVFQIYK